jgi:hypothetical protein
METGIKKKEPQELRLMKYSTVLSAEGGSFYLNIYKGEPVSDECIKEQIRRLQIAFPQCTKEFYAALANRIIDLADEFTDQRLIDAVNHCIDTFKYPQPTAAEILAYNKKINLLTYEQIKILKIKREEEGKLSPIKEYRPVAFYHTVEDEQWPLWASINDINMFKLSKHKEHGVKEKSED